MDESRRKFLKLTTATATAAGAMTLAASKSHAVPSKAEDYSDSMGVLHDVTLCIGCRTCEEACNKVNSLSKPEKPFKDLSVLDQQRQPTVDAYTVVNRYREAEKGATTVFRKTQCNHCLDPACASACFVKALKKTPEGPVVYDPTICVGCRYCLVACAWYVPAYDYDNAYSPTVKKCNMCEPRLKKGQLPGCVEACPMEALIFGKRGDLIKIARERIMKNPERYTDHIYGEHENGGTAWLYLAGSDFKELGFPELPQTAPTNFTFAALGAVPMVMGLWPAFLTGIWAMSRRKEKVAAQEQALAVAETIEVCNEEKAGALQKAAEKAKKTEEKAIKMAVKKALAEAAKKAKEAEEAEKANAEENI